MERHVFVMQGNVAFEAPNATAPLDALVIGAGPAGLAAAKYLLDAGRSVLVREKRPILGGKLSSWRPCSKSSTLSTRSRLSTASAPS
jgi:cation diffusion facilitator CzcD-associated flavoprotein CzcO